MQSEELSEGNLTDINEKSGHDKKDENISEKVMLMEIFIVVEFSEILHHIKSREDKMLEADSNLGSSMTICQGIKRCLIHIISCRTERRRQPLFKLLLIVFLFFLQKSKTL